MWRAETPATTLFSGLETRTIMTMHKKTNTCSPIDEIDIDGRTFCLHKFIYDPENGLNIKLSDRLDPTRELHRYGQGPFCKFRIKNHLNEKGLYCYAVKDDFEDDGIKYIGKVTGNKYYIKYIGKVTGNKMTFGTRFNAGYGNISPYNCYKKGQSTNCHINSIVNKELLDGREILVGFYVMENDIEISNLEKELIENNNPGWNIQHNHPK